MWNNRFLFCIVILGALLLRGGLAEASAAPPLVWSGDVLIKGKFRVPADQTLLILPGSRIRFTKGEKGEQGELLIQGTLLAQGRPDAPIALSAAEGGRWQGIRIATDHEQLASRLEWGRVESAKAGLTGRSGQVLISDVEFSENKIGIDIRAALTGACFNCQLSRNEVGARLMSNSSWQIRHSEIESNRIGGILCQGASPRIQGCLLNGNQEYGIACWQGASPLLEQNRISGSESGISVDRGSSPQIRGNIISDNQTGIDLSRLAFPEIIENRIEANQVGLFCNLGAYPRLISNSLANNRQAAIRLGENQSVEVARRGPQASFKPPGSSGARKQVPAALFPADGMIDARGNWWGAAALNELQKGEETSLSFVDDGRNRPLVHYQQKTYPRDKVAVTGWLSHPPEPPLSLPRPLTGLAGRLTLAGKPLVGARLHVFPDVAGCDARPGAGFSAPSGPEGEFLLRLRPGNYHLLVEQADPPLPGVGRCWPSPSSQVRVTETAMTPLYIDLSIE